MSELDQMQTFLEVARVGGFSRAAQRMELPRSTITARVKALESRLGVRLLQRTTRVVTVTDEGRLYLDACELALATLAEAEDTLVSKQGLSGQLRLSIPVDFPMSWLVQLLVEFKQEHPRIRVIVDVSDHPVHLIEDGFDLALRGRDPGVLGIVSTRVLTASLGLYVATSCVDAWQQLPLINPLGIQADIHTRGPVKAGDSWVSTLSLALARELAIGEQVIAILPDNLCKGDVLRGLLKRLDTIEILPKLNLYLVFPSRKHMPKRVRALLDFFVARLRQG